MKNKYLSIRTNAQILHELKIILDFANENRLPNQKPETKTSMIEGLIHFAYETMPKEDEGQTIVGMGQETEDERIERLYNVSEGIGQESKEPGGNNEESRN